MKLTRKTIKTDRALGGIFSSIDIERGGGKVGKIFTSLFFFLCFCITGCMYYSGGYTPDEKTRTYDVAAFQKIPLTFSSDTNLGNTCAEKTKKILERTGLFSTVTYVPRGEISNTGYHIHFEYLRNYYYDRDSTIYIAVLSCGLLPGKEDYSFNSFATVFHEGGEIANFSKKEEMSLIYWLPCILVYPFATEDAVADEIEDRAITALANYATEELIERLRYKD